MTKQAVNKMAQVQGKVKTFFTSGRFIPWAIIIGLLIFLGTLDTCRNRDFQAQENRLDSVTLANQQLTQEKNRLGQIVSTQPVIITADQEELKKITAKNFQLMSQLEKRIKQVNTLIQEKSITGVEDMYIPYEDKQPFDSSDNPCPPHMIATPKDIKLDTDSNFRFSGTILKDGFKINSIQFPDSQRIAVIETKGGFFKRDINGKRKFFRRKSLEIQVVHTNPYVKTIGLSSVIYQPKVKGRWLERFFIAGAASAATIFLIK